MAKSLFAGLYHSFPSTQTPFATYDLVFITVSSTLENLRFALLTRARDWGRLAEIRIALANCRFVVRIPLTTLFKLR